MARQARTRLTTASWSDVYCLADEAAGASLGVGLVEAEVRWVVEALEGPGEVAEVDADGGDEDEDEVPAPPPGAAPCSSC